MGMQADVHRIVPIADNTMRDEQVAVRAVPFIARTVTERPSSLVVDSAKRKVLRRLYASAFGKDLALHCFPMESYKRSLTQTGTFVLLCDHSRALRRILMEPSLKILPRFIEAIAKSVEIRFQRALKRAPSQRKDGSNSADSDVNSGVLTTLLLILVKALSPDISREAATYFATVAKGETLFYPVLKEVLNFGRRDQPHLDDRTEEAAVMYCLREASLQQRHNIQFPLADLIMSVNLPEKCDSSMNDIHLLWKSWKEEDVDSVCAATGCTNLALTKKCVRCHITMYCNAECQRAHWKLHKPVCREDFWIVEGVKVEKGE